MTNRSADAISLSDRTAVKEKIKTAMRKKATNYDDLLEISGALAEEHVFAEALSKLDYYKSGISTCKKIFEIGNAQVATNEVHDSKAESNSDENGPRPVKRAKTQH